MAQVARKTVHMGVASFNVHAAADAAGYALPPHLGDLDANELAIAIASMGTTQATTVTAQSLRRLRAMPTARCSR